MSDLLIQNVTDIRQPTKTVLINIFKVCHNYIVVAIGKTYRQPGRGLSICLAV
jgi:hypothetical protein